MGLRRNFTSPAPASSSGRPRTFPRWLCGLRRSKLRGSRRLGSRIYRRWTASRGCARIRSRSNRAVGLKPLEDSTGASIPPSEKKKSSTWPPATTSGTPRTCCSSVRPALAKPHWPIPSAGFEALYRSIFYLARDFLKDEAFNQQDKTLRKYLKPDWKPSRAATKTVPPS